MSYPVRKAAKLALASTLFVGALSACHGPKDPAVRGKERYSQCVPCHGADGAGKPEIQAPPIAGLPLWYLEAQLDKFRIGVRGTHIDDAAGMRMRPMALTMPEAEDVKAVALYVSTLPATAKPVAMVAEGKADKGKAAFGTCMACHGADGSGNKALNAPPIAGHPDWYVLTQLKNFKHGVRGKHPKDASGATMQAIAATVPEEQLPDLAAYVASLPKK